MKKGLLAVLALSMSVIAAAYAVAIASQHVPAWGRWAMTVAVPFAMVATIAIGAARSGQPLGGLGRLVVPLTVVLLIMLGAFASALLLSAVGEPLILGLPRRTAIVLYGIGLLPALILPVAYALTFDELTLTEEDIERVRAAAARNTAETES